MEMQEQPVVEITTHIGYEVYQKYLKFTIHARSKNLKTQALVFALLLPFLLIIIALFCFIEWTRASHDAVWGVVGPILIGFICGASLFFVLLLLQTFMTSAVLSSRAGSELYKQKKLEFETESTDVFYEEHIEGEQVLPGITRRWHITYDYYPEIIETDSAFYMTIDIKKSEHALLPKECLAPEQIVILREFFARKFGDNFKPYKQK